MNVTNETRYSGVMLRSIFLSVVSEVGKTLRDANRAELIRRSCHVTYGYTRRGGVSGWAAYSGVRCRLRIAREEVALDELIWLVRHEVYHLFDVRHERMPDAVNHRSNGAFAAVRELYPELFERYGDVVREEPKKEKPKPTIDEKRSAKLSSIEKRIESWEAKARRAENALKKLRKQKRYYEGQLALAAKGPT